MNKENTTGLVFLGAVALLLYLYRDQIQDAFNGLFGAGALSGSGGSSGVSDYMTDLNNYDENKGINVLNDRIEILKEYSNKLSDYAENSDYVIKTSELQKINDKFVDIGGKTLNNTYAFDTANKSGVLIIGGEAVASVPTEKVLQISAGKITNPLMAANKQIPLTTQSVSQKTNINDTSVFASQLVKTQKTTKTNIKNNTLTGAEVGSIAGGVAGSGLGLVASAGLGLVGAGVGAGVGYGYSKYQNATPKTQKTIKTAVKTSVVGAGAISNPFVALSLPTTKKITQSISKK